MPQTSIIIPMYNEERYITRCLESLTKQTYQDFEIILIDDGSTDKTIEKASTYRVKILKQKHGGPGKARNWGAQVATGDIFVFIDADMYFDIRYLEELIKPIQEGREIGTSHGTELIGNPENKLARAWSINRIPHPPERSWVFRAILKESFLKTTMYNDDRYAFEDDFSKKIGTALMVRKAVCYHNNPEHLLEILHHEIWIGESLIAKGVLKIYLHEYQYWLLWILIWGMLVMMYSIINRSLSILLWWIISIMFLMILTKALQRTFKEKYISHLIYIPIVMIARWIGCIVGIVKCLISN